MYIFHLSYNNHSLVCTFQEDFTLSLITCTLGIFLVYFYKIKHFGNEWSRNFMHQLIQLKISWNMRLISTHFYIIKALLYYLNIYGWRKSSFGFFCKMLWKTPKNFLSNSIFKNTADISSEYENQSCSLPGSSVHGILQAKILEWIAILFSRASSQPKDWTQVSCIAGRFFIIWATREAQRHA